MSKGNRKAGGWVEGHFSEELEVRRNRPAIEELCAEK